jgi:hypothetical protein
VVLWQHCSALRQADGYGTGQVAHVPHKKLTISGNVLMVYYALCAVFRVLALPLLGEKVESDPAILAD